jgi:diguanylate cyclase (GGDEF)-like protein/PAS domain S-box-containing protein
MHALTGLSLLAVLIYLNIGVYLYNLNKRTVLNTLFFLLCVSMAIWSFGYAFVYESIGDSAVWMRISSIGWCTFSTFILHSTIRFTEVSWFLRSRMRQGLLYLPSALFLSMSLIAFYPGSQPGPAIERFFYIGDFLYDFLYLLLSLLLINRWGRRASRLSDKKNARILLAAGGIPFLLNFIDETVLGGLGFNQVPAMGHLYGLITVGGIYYAAKRYRLFTIPTALLLDEMLAEMMDLFFLLSPEGNIMKVNSHAAILLGYPAEALRQQPVQLVFPEGEVLNTLLAVAVDEGDNTRRYLESTCRKVNGEGVPIRLSLSPIRDQRTRELLGYALLGQDITLTRRLEQEIWVHEQAEARLRESEERFRAMFDNHQAVMYLSDPTTLSIFAANEAAHRYYGYTTEQFLTMKLTDLTEIEPGEAALLVSEVLADTRHVLVMKHRMANGERRDVEIHASPVPIGGKQMLYLIVHDITERKRAEAYITYLAHHDNLTGLANRKAFYERLEEELVAAAEANMAIAVLYLDLDRFKSINDTYGHEAGDRLLVEITSRIHGVISPRDLLARLGGDEFALIMCGLSGREEALLAAERIQLALLPIRQILADGKSVSISVSIGISLYPEDGQTSDVLVRKADSGMYAIKKGGEKA